MKKGEITIGWIIGLVIGLILLIIISIVLFPNLIEGIKEIPACKAPNICGIDNCQDGYTERMFTGGGWCEDHSLGNVCCVPVKKTPGQAVSAGDVVITANGDITKPIANNGVVEMSLDNKGAKLELDMAFTDVAKYVCYGQIKEDGKTAVTVHIDQLFKQPTPTGLASTTTVADLIKENPKCEPPDKATLELKTPDLLNNFGKETTYSIVMLDKEKCKEKQIRQCPPVHTQTIIVKVPDRRPAISLKEGAVEFSRYELNMLPVGSHQLIVEVDEPYPVCEIMTTQHFGDRKEFSSVLDQFKFTGKVDFTQDCFDAKTKELPIRINIDDEVVRGIPFEVTVVTTTKKDDKEAARVEETFKFQIPEHAELKVIGPATGIAREKSIDIICKDIQCNSQMEVALIPDPFTCKPEGISSFPKVETATVEGSNRFRFTIKDQDESLNYVCVKGTKAGKDIYALGLWRGVPSQILIDNESPQLELDFDYLRGKISFSCKDTSENPLLVSGCKEHPFSYSYVSDPLRFIGFIVPIDELFNLGDGFRACPEANAESQWVQWNGALNQMDYIGQDVRVLCMRATDNAGNHKTQSQLLFSTAQAVGLLMQSIPGGPEVVR